MKADKAEKIQEKQKDKAPKYMHALLKTAKKRQELHERRIERKVQKERDAEGDEFADKGSDTPHEEDFLLRITEKTE